MNNSRNSTLTVKGRIYKDYGKTKYLMMDGKYNFVPTLVKGKFFQYHLRFVAFVSDDRFQNWVKVEDPPIMIEDISLSPRGIRLWRNFKLEIEDLPFVMENPFYDISIPDHNDVLKRCEVMTQVLRRNPGIGRAIAQYIKDDPDGDELISDFIKYYEKSKIEHLFYTLNKMPRNIALELYKIVEKERSLYKKALKKLKRKEAVFRHVWYNKSEREMPFEIALYDVYRVFLWVRVKRRNLSHREATRSLDKIPTRSKITLKDVFRRPKRKKK